MQQAEQRLPGVRIQGLIFLGQVTAGGIDQDGVLGEVPVRVTRGGDVLGQAVFIGFVEGEVETGKVQQAGLATALRAQ
ncbi:hypothetical protein D9M68_562660 [compost metagenome]